MLIHTFCLCMGGVERVNFYIYIYHIALAGFEASSYENNVEKLVSELENAKPTHKVVEELMRATYGGMIHQDVYNILHTKVALIFKGTAQCLFSITTS